MNALYSVTKTLRPDDIRPGDYVVVLAVTHECFPLMYEDHASFEERASSIRHSALPDKRPEVLRVVSICVPVVLTVLPTGGMRLIDTRREQLGRVSEHFGQTVFEQVALARERRARDSEDGEQGEDDLDD